MARRWKRAITAPSNSVPRPVLTVAGENAFQTIVSLQKLVQEKDNEASNKQLDDDQKTNSSTNVTWVSIHASQDIHNGLSNSDHHSKELLGSIEQSSVLRSVPHLYQLGTSQQLHDQTGGHDGGDTQLHEGSSVGSEDDTDPVERIG